MIKHHRDFEMQSAEAMERLRHATTFAQIGLQSLTLINGGALVALFTFVGTSGTMKFDVSTIWASFAFFSAGLVFNVLAFLGAYVSQDRFYVVAQYEAWNAESKIGGLVPVRDPHPPHRIGSIAQYLAIGLAMLSLCAFIIGAGFALGGATGL